MNWVDGLIVAIVVLSAVRGFWTGAATQTSVAIGVWLGLLLGVVLTPPLAGLASGAARSLVALSVLAACMIAVGVLGEVVGRYVKRFLLRANLGIADAVGGVAVAAVAALLTVWLLGNVLAVSRYPRLNSALQESVVMRTANRVLPPVPELFARIESFLSSRGYPVVFTNLPPGLIAPAQLPSDSAIQEAFRAAQDSTVKVVGQACGLIESGSGFVAAPGLVVTNAHVVAGESRTQVVDRAGTHQATVVLYDPDLDVAVLRVSGLVGAPLPIEEATVARGTAAAIMGYPGGGPLTAVPAAVTARIQASGLNIYGTAVVSRSVYELNGDVQPGNSGGPLVASGQPAGSGTPAPGTVVGVVFASSTMTEHVGYALTMDGVSEDIKRSESASGAVSTGACIP